jgi:Asp/Glu/hydantoin racemase
MSFTIGFLHTAQVHVDTFTELVGPKAHTRHVVDESLLVDARAHGVDDALRDRLVARLREAADGSGVVVCTCSTISGEVERLASHVAVPVIRIDRSLAQAAVSIGRRVAVVAAVESTVAPTSSLLHEVAADENVEIDLSVVRCFDAWPHFERGDTHAYLHSIARHVNHFPDPVDVFVLAQASMAGATECCEVTVPVLSSPGLAVVAALAHR